MSAPWTFEQDSVSGDEDFPMADALLVAWGSRKTTVTGNERFSRLVGSSVHGLVIGIFFAAKFRRANVRW